MESLEKNPNITQIDVRSNEFVPETVDQINEIVTKNFLKQQNISYFKIPQDCKYQSFLCNQKF